MNKILAIFIILFLLNAPQVFAQEILLTPPNPNNSQIQKASTGIPFGQGWNYFNLGFDNCTTLTVLNELQADGGSALNVNAIFVKEFVGWQNYTFQSPKQKKVSANETIAFNSNQKFFLQIDENACLGTDSTRQKQIEKVREGVKAKDSFVEKVGELPLDLWTKLTNILNREGAAPDNATGNKQNLDNLIIGGKTTVNDLGITGKITAGLLTINGFNNVFASLDTLSDDLYLQSKGVGGVNILNGKVTIDKNGNLKVTKLNFDVSDATSSSVGSATLQSGATSIDISTSAITTNSKVFITATSETGGQALIVKSKTAGRGFRVIVEKSYSSNITFDWLVVN